MRQVNASPSLCQVSRYRRWIGRDSGHRCGHKTVFTCGSPSEAGCAAFGRPLRGTHRRLKRAGSMFGVDRTSSSRSAGAAMTREAGSTPPCLPLQPRRHGPDPRSGSCGDEHVQVTTLARSACDRPDVSRVAGRSLGLRPCAVRALGHGDPARRCLQQRTGTTSGLPAPPGLLRAEYPAVRDPLERDVVVSGSDARASRARSRPARYLDLRASMGLDDAVRACLSTSLPSVAPISHDHWEPQPLPGNSRQFDLAAVSADSSDDVWVVGGGGGLNGVKPVVIHWDGQRLRLVRAPSPGFQSGLFGVSAISPSSAWAVGSRGSIHNRVSRNERLLGRDNVEPAVTGPTGAHTRPRASDAQDRHVLDSCGLRLPTAIWNGWAGPSCARHRMTTDSGLKGHSSSLPGEEHDRCRGVDHEVLHRHVAAQERLSWVRGDREPAPSRMSASACGRRPAASDATTRSTHWLRSCSRTSTRRTTLTASARAGAAARRSS